MHWHAVMPADELWIGEMLGVEVGGVNVLLVNIEDEVRAFLDRCPHRASRLSEGDLDGCTIVCGTHLWEFDALTGCGVNPASARLITFPVKVEDGLIHIQVPDREEIPEHADAEDAPSFRASR
jgi:toluene monooxygenase system ferredoxin subunit